jgi:hypothetical protein
VRSWIATMKARGEAFYSEASGTYLLAGVFFERTAAVPAGPGAAARPTGAARAGASDRNGSSYGNGGGASNGNGSGNGAVSGAMRCAGGNSEGAGAGGRRDLSAELLKLLTALE